MESQWLSSAKKLQAIASTGLHFAKDEYDLERYAEIGEIAQTLLAELGDVPLDRIQKLVPEYAKSYATPMVDVRGAVFSGPHILLVRERTDGLWTLPGGYADVGLSAAENVEKEIAEEASLSVKARKLYALQHKAKHAYNEDVRDFYKLFFLCEQIDEAQPVAGSECMDAAFFKLDNLPQLSQGRVIREDIVAAFDHFADPMRSTVFD